MNLTAIQCVAAERRQQEERFGVQRHKPSTWLAILGEEFGEVSKEVADSRTGARAFDGKAYRQELVQVAAVAVAAIESYDARPW